MVEAGLGGARPETRRPVVPLVLGLAVAYAALAIYVGSLVTGGTALSLPALGLPMAVFALSQMMIPSMRLALDHPFSPRNWVLFLFTLQLIVIPVLIILLGLASGSLSALPSSGFITAALALQTLAYVGYVIGFLAVTRGRQDARPALFAGEERCPPGRFLICLAFAIGAVGLFLRFGSAGQVIGYFTGTSSVAYDLSAVSGVFHTVGQSVSAFLLPFLGIGFVLIGCSAIERPLSGRLRRLLLGLVVLVGLAAAFSLYNYNRGALVIPLLAMAATFSLRGRRLSLVVVGAAGATLIVLVIGIGAFRVAYFDQQLGLDTITGASPSFNDTVQVYGQGPQFLGYLLEMTPPGDTPLWGGTLVSAVLSPVPVLGQSFRTTSATTTYNDLIYGPGGASDQIVPLPGELDWNFSAVGVLVGFVALGAAIAFLDRRAQGATTALGTYTIEFFAFWVGFLVLVSVQVVSQASLYFGLPLASVVALDLLRRRAVRARRVART
jgi:oligosaccharide repeat unit polymerase